ncbi:hypothetical protein AM588_10004371 [Phytophthora nicotianae]|uniref:rRNA adenine N(6)-methyltransferase n=1 Tax=Phytophthora nicotianae TaxID=4792 RepID=A0A0W8DBN4_PHYNI|nr:hypothetical protein AM588_10004371 [Phytophthora nicotianae]
MMLPQRLVSRACSLCTLGSRRASTSNVSRLRGTPHLKRKLGQHLLVSDGILDQIVAASDLSDTSSDPVRVLEIGPGTGNLTSALLQVSPKMHVHAVEFDPRMVEQLKLRFPAEIESGSLVLEHSDFEDFRFVADTYQEKPMRKTDVSSVVKVPREHFLPPPKVDSRVIKLVPRAASTPALPSDDELFFQKFDALLRLCFLRKNKTLRALLLAKTARSQYVLKEDTLTEGEDKHQAVTERVEAALEASGLKSNRAVKVSVAEFVKLLQELRERGIDLRPSTTRHFQD